jgi:putative membrane protein
MPVMRKVLLTAGVVVLAIAWLGPLSVLARWSFSAHMMMHMAVVAVAAPFIALGVSTSRLDPVGTRPGLFAPIPASIVEFIVVWAWHTPALHHAARHEMWAFVLEQSSFLAAGLFLWVAVLGGDRALREPRRGAGVVALLFTSMHMTLLGVLFALAPRPLYEHGAIGPPGLSSLSDQHLGGAIMLLVGGTAYMIGGLCLTAGLLRHYPVEERTVSS